ncbi:MAG: copper amine oxidase N-terminal domain-containing protein, partial [Oscillospiraceae bacterium]|nr:copper amine oxidase N-terminal domain-containing protein [Oscillospiraceae bacterium]
MSNKRNKSNKPIPAPPRGQGGRNTPNPPPREQGQPVRPPQVPPNQPTQSGEQSRQRPKNPHHPPRPVQPPQEGRRRTPPAPRPKDKQARAKGPRPSGGRPQNAPPRPEGGRPPAPTPPQNQQKRRPSLPPKSPKPPKPPRQKRKRRNVTIPTATIVNMITAAMLVFILIVAGHFVTFIAQTNHRLPRYTITVQHREGGEVVRTTQINRREVFRDGDTMYINLSRLVADESLEMNLVTVGARGFTMFSVRGDTDQRVIFVPYSSEMDMNGRRVRLSAPVQFVGRYVYVPVCFFWHYTTGFHVYYSAAERTLYITRQIVGWYEGMDENDNDNNDSEVVLIPFSFNIHHPTAAE